jgi:excisionase family DNA binding protein
MSEKLTTNQAAEYLGVKPQQIYTLTHLGLLWPLKVKNRVYFSKDELDRYARSKGKKTAERSRDPVTVTKRSPGLAKSQAMSGSLPPLLPHLQTKGIGGNGINQ